MYEYDVTPRVGVETEKSKANVEGRAAGYGECADRKKSKVNGYKKSVSSGGMVYIVQMPEDGVGGRGTMPAASDEGG